MHFPFGKIFTDRCPPLCFVHIPKTGGGSVRFYLQKLVGKRRILWTNGVYSADEWVNIKPADLAMFKVVGGHIQGPDFRNKLSENTNFATIVRSPVERAVSLFNFITNPRNPNYPHPQKNELIALGLDNAVFESDDFIRQIHDAQCGFICGKRSAKDAIAVIESENWIVDTIQNIELIAQRMSDALSRKKTVKLGHAKRRLGPPDPIKHRTLQRILELTQEDSILYNNVADKS